MELYTVGLHEKESFAGIISEIMLEDLSSGFRVARHVKSESKHEGTAVLLVSAMKELTGLDFSERVSTGDLPADRLMHKPEPADLVVHALEDIIG